MLLFVQGNVFQDAVFNQTVTITEREDGLDGETYVSALALCPVGCSRADGFVCAAQDLHVRLPVGSGSARHHRPSSAAGVQKGEGSESVLARSRGRSLLAPKGRGHVAILVFAAQS